jgi:drug/metabolite transporter (DMT)-like permease
MKFFTYISLVFTMLFWGGTFIAGRILAGSVPPASAAFYRFAIATVVLAILARLIDGRICIPARKQWIPLTLLGLTGVFCYNMLFFSGLQYISAGRASLIIALNPLLITISAVIFFRETLSLRQFGGVLLSLSGALVVISNGNPATVFSGGFGRGELAILGCVASWATYSLIGRKVLTTLSPLASVFYSSLIGTLLLAGPALQQGAAEGLFLYSKTAWLSLAFLGLFGTAIGFSLYYQAIKKIGSSRSSVFINLVPFFSICLSWLILDESVKPVVLVGGLILLAGVALTNYQGKKSAQKNDN